MIGGAKKTSSHPLPPICVLYGLQPSDVWLAVGLQPTGKEGRARVCSRVQATVQLCAKEAGAGGVQFLPKYLGTGTVRVA